VDQKKDKEVRGLGPVERSEMVCNPIQKKKRTYAAERRTWGLRAATPVAKKEGDLVPEKRDPHPLCLEKRTPQGTLRSKKKFSDLG